VWPTQAAARRSGQVRWSGPLAMAWHLRRQKLAVRSTIDPRRQGDPRLSVPVRSGGLRLAGAVLPTREFHSNHCRGSCTHGRPDDICQGRYRHVVNCRAPPGLSRLLLPSLPPLLLSVRQLERTRIVQCGYPILHPVCGCRRQPCARTPASR
jgi:hypothetical protein